MATTAPPSISFAVTFSLRIAIEMGMITMGEMEEREETMPVAVCCRASSARLTPIKGPKTEPNVMYPNAFFCPPRGPPLFQAIFFRTVIIMVKPIKAAIKRIWVAAKAL